MHIIGAQELRSHLSRYIGLVEKGETIYIVRGSRAVAFMAPMDAASEKVVAEKDMTTSKDGSVRFRKLGPYEDPGKVRAFHGYPDEHDMFSPASYCEGMCGEFWVGEAGKELVATGGFVLDLTSDTEANVVRPHRILVVSRFADGEVEASLLELLAERARALGRRLVR